MTIEDLKFLKRWFSDFCRAFYSSNKDDQKNITLKEEHTHRVCRNSVRIATEQSLSSNEILLSEAIALFHDVGRFPQYATYRTFRDSISVNHGKLGADILNEKGILKILPQNEQHIILDSVKFHNAFAVPDIKSKETIFFLRLIRDADKLDIWRVFIELYQDTDDTQESAANLGLPDSPEYSEKIIHYINNKQIVPIAHLKTLNDFRLLQLSWVYDLNFKSSFRLLLEEGYIRKIASTLPQTDEIKNIPALLEEFATEKLRKD